MEIFGCHEDRPQILVFDNQCDVRRTGVVGRRTNAEEDRKRQ